MEMIPEKYKTMIGGRPSFRVDAHSGAISEVILIKFLCYIFGIANYPKRSSETAC